MEKRFLKFHDVAHKNFLKKSKFEYVLQFIETNSKRFTISVQFFFFFFFFFGITLYERTD